MTNPLKPLVRKVLDLLADDPRLGGVSRPERRAVVKATLEALPEAFLPRALPAEDERLDRYTIRDLLEGTWVGCADGSVRLQGETRLPGVCAVCEGVSHALAPDSRCLDCVAANAAEEAW